MMKHIIFPAAIIISFLAGTFLAFPAFSQGITFEDGPFESVKEKAEKQKKLIFVDAYTSWCGPCKHMSKHVFTDGEVGDFYNENFINFKLDMEKGEGIAFAQKYNVRAYPTLLFISSSGDLLHQSLGALPAEEFIKLGKDALNPETQIAILRHEYKNGNRESGFLRTYLLQTLKAGYAPGDIADAYFKSLPDGEFVNEENFELIQMLRPGMDNRLFRAVLAHKEEFEEKVGEARLNQFLSETCKWDLMKTAYKGSEQEFGLKMAAIEHLDLENNEEILTYGELYYAQRENDTEAYIEALEKYSEGFADDDWNTLNTLAWEIYENELLANKELYKIAMKMAKKSISIEQNYYNTDTYAALLYKLGKYKKSRKWADEAIELAKKEGIEFHETKELLKKLDAAQK